jgi:hypothetical protein
MARRAARVDDNQGDIVAALRKMGCSVQPLHTVGQGCPDILVGYDGLNLAIEIKDGQKVPSAQSLTDAQQIWHHRWMGQVVIIGSPEEACQYVRDVSGPW